MALKLPAVVHRVVPKMLLPGTAMKRRVITAFAERSDMVYFGHVSQRSDEHHIVRGLTVSTKHIDDHYCIGTFKNYDVVFVERSDTIRKNRRHMWHIIEIDLKTTADIPHVFIGSSKSGFGFHDLLATKYPSMVPVQFLPDENYPHAFTSHYSLYIAPPHATTIKHLLSPDIAEMVGKHFKGLVIELTEQALYIYSERSSLTGELLDTMLANGVWLARTIDEKSQSL